MCDFGEQTGRSLLHHLGEGKWRRVLRAFSQRVLTPVVTEGCALYAKINIACEVNNPVAARFSCLDDDLNDVPHFSELYL